MILLKEELSMIDNIDKNASVNFDDYELTIEEILGPRDTYTRMKCSKCGYEENVPDWVLDEFAEEDRFRCRKKEVSTECPRCNHAMFKKK